jgi:hypothetical protein
MAPPAANQIALNCNGTSGTITLVSSQGTNFRMDDAVGVRIDSAASFWNCTVNAGNVTLGFSSGYAGNVQIGIQLGASATLTVGGNFTPGTILMSWERQSGTPIIIAPGQVVAIS